MSADTKNQSLGNHARYVPGYHFATGALVAVIFVWAVRRYMTLPGVDAGFDVLVAIALLAEFWYLRQFPLRVQDRLIRLEEQLRLERLAPSEAASLLASLTPNQLVALRFASDAELPSLARRVVAQGITKRSAIKALVMDWRPDHLRA